MRLLAQQVGPTYDTSSLHPAGPVNDHINTVYTALFWTSVIVFFGVAAVIIYSAIRFRRRHDAEEPRQIHGNSRIELAWTIVPFVILVSLFGLTAANMSFITGAPADAMHVCVEGQQFQWNYYYENGCGTPRSAPEGRVTYRPLDKNIVKTSVRLYVPVGKPVALDLVSDDVNHSFYVPRLAGQVNAIPGQVNHLWLQADRPGDYIGQCTELCGSGHNLMELDVVGVPSNRFAQCIDQVRSGQQAAPACIPGGA